MKPRGRSRAATGGYAPAVRREVEARTRECPKCEAPIGERCRDPRRRVYVNPIARAHKERHTQQGGSGDE